MDDAVAKVLEEVRRLGRATIATQASAQACLEVVERLEGRMAAERSRAEVRPLLERLIPVFDALERIAASASEERVGPPWARRPTRTAEALRILTAQLQAALAGGGIELIRDVNVPFNEDAHRAVERIEDPAVDAPQVRSLVAPGYVLDGRAVREAQVVVAIPDKRKD